MLANGSRAANFTRFEMGATLTGAKLFQQRGYVAVERLEVPLEGDITLPIIHMVKGHRIRTAVTMYTCLPK